MNKKNALLTIFFFIMILSVSVLFLSSCGSKSSTLETVPQKQYQVTLPDFMSFTNNNACQYSPKKESTAIHIMYNIDKEPGVITEYVNLIRNKYNFQIIAVDDKKNVDGLNTYKFEYGFVCSDNSVKQFSEEINKKSERLHFYILVYAFEDMNWLVEIKYGEGINYIDTGDRTTHKLKNINYESEPKKEETKSQSVSQSSRPQESRDTKPTKTTSTPEPPKTQPAPSVTRSQSDTYLPDFLAFANNKIKVNWKRSDDNSQKEQYAIATIPGKYSASDVIQEYINLVTSKYNFRMIQQKYDRPNLHFGLIYTGTGSVKQFTETRIGSKDKINVRITVWDGDSKGEIIIQYADGINYTDTGDRTRFQIQEVKNNPQPSGSGGGSSFDYPSGPEMRNAADEIRDRQCFRCDGRGYIEEFEYYNGPHYGETPPPGITVRKTCPDCGGTGRIKLNW